MAIEIDFACPRCDHEALVDGLESAAALSCPCGWSAPPREGALAGGRLARCALCGDPRLYRQKDFSRKVGIGLLAAGFALALLLGVVAGPVGFFAALGVSVALDAALYLVAGTVVVCHWCEAHYRGASEDRPEFDLAVHDLVRWQRELAARGQPVPEHEGPEHEGRAPAPGAAEPQSTRYDG